MGKATYTGDGVFRVGDKPYRKGDEIECSDEVAAELSKRGDFRGEEKPKANPKRTRDKDKDKDEVI